MKKTRRFLSAALAAAVFGSASAVVAVADTAITAGTTTLSDGDYTLSGDVTLTGTIIVPAGVTATIDLNGNTLNGPNNTAIIVNGTLTVKDSGSGGKLVGNNKVNQNYNIKVEGTGTLNWESGTFEDAGVGASGRLTSIDVGTNRHGGTINITGGKFIGGDVKNLIQVPDGTLTINDAEINANTRALVVGCDTTITDTTLKGGIYVVGGATGDSPEINITDSGVTGDIITGVGSVGDGTGVVTMSGGSFTGALDYGTREDTSGTVKFEDGAVVDITDIKNAGNAAAGQLVISEDVGTFKVNTSDVTAANGLLPTNSPVEIAADGTIAKEYRISFIDVPGVGTAAVSTNKAVAGTEITVTITPATGYTLQKITYTVDDGASVDVAGNTFTMPAGNVKITPVFTAPYKAISVSKTFPAGFNGDRKTAAEKITSKITKAEVTNGKIVVTFNDTYANIKKIMDGDDLLKVAAPTGVDPIYLDITTDIPDTVPTANFAFASGYGFDSATHSDNFDQSHIKVWLNPAPANSPKTITYTINGGTVQTLTIEYTYKTSTTSGGGSGSSSTTKPSANNTNSNSTTNPTKNPSTGIALAAAPAILAAAAVIVASKKRK